MRTKLFIAFFVVIVIALVSNFIFERLIIRDFEEFVMGSEEDQVYRVLAAVEGSYLSMGEWDVHELKDALQWAAMLGFEVQVRDVGDERLIDTAEAIKILPPALKRRVDALVDLEAPAGPFETYPLFVEGRQIGELSIRPLQRAGLLSQKEAVFKQRGQNFLFISFLIAGGGALFLSIVFSMFLTVPLMRLKKAAEAVAKGDLDVKVKGGGDDEVGRLTRSFNRMVESLRREEELRRHLTSNIAHELRTPLAVMKANLEAMADGVVTDVQEGVGTAMTETNRLINLVEGIEDITKAEASFFKQPQYEPLALRLYLLSLVQSMQPLFSKSSLVLELDEGPGIDVLTDPEKLDIILRNITANALRHTDTGGARVSYGPADSGFFVTVSDTGAGMSEEEASRAFDRFYKGEGSEGVGLGLSIANELAEMMGGQISVSSKPDRGSSFTVTLPPPKESE